MDKAPPARQRRLQRDKDFTGDRLSSFRDVFLRHGLPGLLLALGFLCLPGFWDVFVESVERGLATPERYLVGAVLIFAGLNAYAWWTDGHLRLSTLGWIAYLGALSFWEEWVFRLAMPHLLEGVGASAWGAAIVSALVFGGAHYVTLRWKWQWCVGAFIGGLALSRHMGLHGDLLLITAFHWIATSVNTPRPPGQSATREAA